MGNTLTLKDYQNRIDNSGLDFKILDFKKGDKKSKFKHSCGHIFETRLSHLLNRNRCPICDGVWRTKEMFQKKSDEIHNSEYVILEFKNGNYPVKIEHKVCGEIFTQIGNRHLRGDRCFKCYGNKKLSSVDIINRSNEYWDSEYEILSNNIKYTEKSFIKHKKCGYEYIQLVSSHLIGHGCPKCAGNAPLTKEMVQEKSDKIHNNEYIILSELSGAFSKIEIKHKKCGRIFTQVISDHFSGCGCSVCNKSKFENYIEYILIKNNINHQTQKTFDDCKFKNKLKFDFYLVDENICIEFDGIQHFKPIRFFGGKKSFDKFVEWLISCYICT
jgi:predicted  nucleic acid-binding Zn-ribbon protein